MINQDTLLTAINWYESGAHRVTHDSVRLGITYLEKAIAVFMEVGETIRATRARHYMLLGLRRSERYEDVERMFPEVMEGYTQQEDAYGQALLLTHLADTLSEQERWEMAVSYYNLASVVAENDQQAEVLGYIYLQQGALYEKRDDLLQADRVYLRAEKLSESTGDIVALARCRHLRGETLNRLGELSEAVALLEDAQTRLLRVKAHQLALGPLSLLRTIYEGSGMAEDRARISQLINLSGQRMIQADTIPVGLDVQGPPIDPELGEHPRR